MQGNKHAHNDPPIQLLYIAMKKNRKITQFFAAQIFLPYPVRCPCHHVVRTISMVVATS
jgi:hypothetical protein